MLSFQQMIVLKDLMLTYIYGSSTQVRGSSEHSVKSSAVNLDSTVDKAMAQAKCCSGDYTDH